MAVFIMGSLAVLIAAFLVMLAIQVIRIEKNVLDMVDITEHHVSRLYEPGAMQ